MRQALGGLPGASAPCPEAQALGKSQGGLSTKLHLRAEGGGKPMLFVLTPGQQHESTVFVPLLARGAVRRMGRGRPRLRPQRLAGDKAYNSGAIRAYLRQRGIRQTIPRFRNQRRASRFNRAAYRQRNRIERLINRLKQSRRVATRYEKLAVHFHAMVLLAAIVLWL